MVYVWFGNSATTSFAFTFTAGPQVKFVFDKISTPDDLKNRPFKRRRPLWDVDGSSSEGKKKRRLRLNLITSRLSRPFSQPASNIVDRGISKIAIWAKNRRRETNELRKAAIMNRVRSRLDTAKAKAREAQNVVRHATALSELSVQKPRHHELPPSPLGLSNYDALDLEDEIWGDDDGDSLHSTIYSDFNVMNPYTGTDGDSYDYLDELDGIPHEMPEDRPPPPPDERFSEILKEKERQKEIYFVKFLA